MALCSIAIAAGVLGAVVLVRRMIGWRRCGHLAFAGGPCGGGPRGFRFGGHRGGIGGSFWLRALYARLDTTPGQEREIRSAIEELRERARDARSGLPETRESLAKAIAGEAFDPGAFEVVSARFDAAAAKVKDALSSALQRIHAVLDAKQRERLAEIVGRGGFGRFRGGWRGGPYRDGADL